ncbi:MAG: hypothetical protein K6L73_07975 [Cellvibrionaceae bacterium]
MVKRDKQRCAVLRRSSYSVNSLSVSGSEPSGEVVRVHVARPPQVKVQAG